MSTTPADWLTDHEVVDAVAAVREA